MVYKSELHVSDICEAAVFIEEIPRNMVFTFPKTLSKVPPHTSPLTLTGSSQAVFQLRRRRRGPSQWLRSQRFKLNPSTIHMAADLLPSPSITPKTTCSPGSASRPQGGMGLWPAEGYCNWQPALFWESGSGSSVDWSCTCWSEYSAPPQLGHKILQGAFCGAFQQCSNKTESLTDFLKS